MALHRDGRSYSQVHHGVRISDSALVEAAVLSDRYIADRFLPDKVRPQRVMAAGCGLRGGSPLPDKPCWAARCKLCTGRPSICASSLAILHVRCALA